jgi:hypothetical protein
MRLTKLDSALFGSWRQESLCGELTQQLVSPSRQSHELLLRSVHRTPILSILDLKHLIQQVEKLARQLHVRPEHLLPKLLKLQLVLPLHAADLKLVNLLLSPKGCFALRILLLLSLEFELVVCPLLTNRR